MFKKTIIAIVIAGFLATMALGKPAVDKPGRARHQNGVGRNQRWLAQLKQAYQQEDMDKIGKILNKMENRKEQSKTGKSGQWNKQLIPKKTQLKQGKGLGKAATGRRSRLGRRKAWLGRRGGQGRWQAMQKPGTGAMRGRRFGQHQGRSKGRRQAMRGDFARLRCDRDNCRMLQSRGRFDRKTGRGFAGRRTLPRRMNRATPQRKHCWQDSPAGGQGRNHTDGKLPMRRREQKERFEWNW